MSAASRPEPELPRWLVRNRNFVLLWAAYGISAVGDHLSEMALLVERDALGQPHATRIQALITFGFFLPFVVLGPLAGWWADRFSRKWTMITTDLLRAAVMLSLIWTVRWLVDWLEPHGFGDYAIVLPLLVTGALAAFFSPARQALLPILIRPDHLVRANALISALGTIATIVSYALGGLIVTRWGKQWNYSLDAVTFLFSACLLSFILMSRTRAVPHPRLVGVWTPVVEGFRYVRDHRRVLQMILLGTVFWAASGVVVSVVPALVRDVFGGDIAQAGIYRGFIGVGLVLGAATMTVVGRSMPIQLAVLLSTVGGTFWVWALAVVCGFKFGALLAAVCLVGIGAAGAALLVTIMATIQRFVPDARLGRVFGVSDMCTMAAIVAATGMLGLPDIPDIDAYVPWLLGGVGLLLGATAWLAWREYRRDDPHRPAVAFFWLVLKFYARFWLGVKRVGPCTIPREGPVILALNHTAGVDPMAIYTTCPHRLAAFVVAKEYYELPVLSWFQRQVHCVPIDRENPGKSFLTGCLRLLKQGGLLGIFPEGTWAQPGEEQPEAKSGVGVLALRTGATVIPCHISGTLNLPTALRSYFLRHRMRVRYGRPIDLSAFRGREKDRRAPQEISDLIMARIRELGAGVTADEA